MSDQSINVSNLFMAKLTREQVKEKFANDSRLDKILSIFDKINGLDGKNDEVLSEFDLHNMASLEYGPKWPNGEPKVTFLQNKFDDKVTDYELEQYMQDAKAFYGDDIEIEDYRKFLGFVAANGDEVYAQKVEDLSQKLGMSKELVEKFGTAIAEEYKRVEKDGKVYYERRGEGFTELRDENGKLLQLREDESTIIGYEGFDQITNFDENGETSVSYTNHKTNEQIIFEYGKTPDDKSYKIHIKDGVAVRQSHTYSEDDLYWRNMQLEDVIFNAGNSDSTKVSFKYDENNKLTGIDIKDNSLETDSPQGFMTDGKAYLTHVPQKTSLDDSTAKAIQQMIDGGARYGEDFDLKIVDGKLQVVPKIENKTGKETPELTGDAFDKYKDLVGAGVHAGEDFDVEYDENGNFRYHLKNNQAKGYDAEYRSEVYDKDGNFLSSLTVKDGQVIKENMSNGLKQTSEMSFEDAFMELITEQNFNVAGEILGKDDILTGGYNIYPAAEKYKQMTGRELIGDVFDAIQNAKDEDSAAGMNNLLAKLQPHRGNFENTKDAVIKNYYEGYNQFKEILNFDPKNSQIADMLPKIQRIQDGENSFTEKINNDNFNVNIAKNQITISKNGQKAKTIDISELPENYVKKVFSKINSAVLYDIASCGAKVKLDDQINSNSKFGNTTNGLYTNKDGGIIVLDPNALIGERAAKTIAHEAGHMCDCIDDKENAIKFLKEQMKDPFATLNRDKPLTIQEMLENNGTLQPVSPVDEKLNEIFKKEMENFNKNSLDINQNALYALNSKPEFFAEAYALLNTGTCKSEYVIANYFPETLKRVKELIEQNRAQRETN